MNSDQSGSVPVVVVGLEVLDGDGRGGVSQRGVYLVDDRWHQVVREADDEFVHLKLGVFDPFVKHSVFNQEGQEVVGVFLDRLINDGQVVVTLLCAGKKCRGLWIDFLSNPLR
jgi:hypothetical protein